MLGHSELQFCKEYHLSESKDLDDIGNTLMWGIGKLLSVKKQCEDKGYIVDDQVSELALSQIRFSEEQEIKSIT